jgi:hypothetical protein
LYIPETIVKEALLLHNADFLKNYLGKLRLCMPWSLRRFAASLSFTVIDNCWKMLETTDHGVPQDFTATHSEFSGLS